MDKAKGRQLTNEQNKQQEKAKSKTWIRSLSKLLFVPLLLFFSLVAGLMIGYGFLGKQPITEVFNVNTYKHMYDLIFSGTS